jgi:hypothetical protein
VVLQYYLRGDNGGGTARRFTFLDVNRFSGSERLGGRLIVVDLRALLLTAESIFLSYLLGFLRPRDIE